MEEFQASQWRNKYPEIPLLKDYVMLCTQEADRKGPLYLSDWKIWTQLFVAGLLLKVWASFRSVADIHIPPYLADRKAGLMSKWGPFGKPWASLWSRDERLLARALAPSLSLIFTVSLHNMYIVIILHAGRRKQSRLIIEYTNGVLW